MRDARIAELAGRRFNRISRQQLRELGLSDDAIAHRLATGRFVVVEQNVFAIAPVLEYDDWGRWMGTTLTAPDTVLSHFSAGAALSLWTLPRPFETVTRPGSGGPRRHGGMLVFRSSTLTGECTALRGIPITSVERTVLDIAPRVSARGLARVVREAVRLELTTIEGLADTLGRHPGRRGSRRLASVLARYTSVYRSSARAVGRRSTPLRSSTPPAVPRPT